MDNLLLSTAITTRHPPKLLTSFWQDVVNCVGGMGVLLPLLEQVVSKKEEPEDEQETNNLVGPELTSSRNAQGMLIPLGKSSGEGLRGHGGAVVLLECLKVTSLPCGCCQEQIGVDHEQERSCPKSNGETIDTFWLYPLSVCR